MRYEKTLELKKEIVQNLVNKNLKTDYFTDLIIENHMNFKIKDKEGDVYHE